VHQQASQFTAGCKVCLSMAGLLTYPCFWRLPPDQPGVASCLNIAMGLTASGTVADLHGIPFSSLYGNH